MREPRTLIVDDDKEFLEILTRYLSNRLKGTIISTPSGAEAYEQLTTQDFDLILVDYQLAPIEGGSRVDGIQLLAEAKRKDPKSVVFLISGVLNETFTNRVELLGGHLIGKPIEMDLLFRLIDRRLTEKGGLDYKKI